MFFFPDTTFQTWQAGLLPLRAEISNSMLEDSSSSNSSSSKEATTNGPSHQLKGTAIKVRKVYYVHKTGMP